jgi:hypothetical protein
MDVPRRQATTRIGDRLISVQWAMPDGSVVIRRDVNMLEPPPWPPAKVRAAGSRLSQSPASAQFRLQVLTPGRWYAGKNSDGTKRYLDFTPEYIRHQYRKNKKLLETGIPVPAPFEHRDDARPGSILLDDLASLKARSTAGWITDYQLDDRDRLFAVVNIPHADDQKRAEAIRFCSPELDQFIDSTGKDWGRVITHVALTPRPRQHTQQPITRLSSGGRNPIRLAIDPRTGEDMFDFDNLDDDGRCASRPTEFGALVEALQGRGLVIPAEVHDLAGLVIAVRANPCLCDDEDEDEDEDLDDEYAEDAMNQQYGRSPVTMSHAGRRPSHPDAKIRRYLRRAAAIDQGPEARKARDAAMSRMCSGRS